MKGRDSEDGDQEIKPGTHTRYIKGQSGNPKGRPRRAGGPAKLRAAGLSELIKAETERLVSLGENGSMPALKAVLRSTVISAIKGNPHAQRLVLQITGASEAQAAKTKKDNYEAAIMLKIQLEHERDIWVARGGSENDMPRHPGDIEIDSKTQEVKSFLLFTEDEIDARRRAIEFRDFLLNEASRSALAALEDGDDDLLELSRELVGALIGKLNAALAPRFRRPLPGAVGMPTCSGTPEEMWRAMTAELASRISGTYQG
jgi:hypothetical protein